MNYFELAKKASKYSSDSETQVGCVFIDSEGRFVAESCNTFVDGYPNNLPTTRPHKHEFMIHAEVNGILKCARDGIATKGLIAYVTLSPCVNCVRNMWQSGITEVYFQEVHPSFEDTLKMKDLNVATFRVHSYYKLVISMR